MKDLSKCHEFIVIKDFYKIGSVCMGFYDDEINLLRSTIARCLLIAESPIQVVRLAGSNALETYSEYKPYKYCEDVQELLDICISGECPGEPNPFIRD